MSIFGLPCMLLRLTASIFKTTEPIYMIFGTVQHCIVLNTSVKSMLNKFLTQVAPPSEKKSTTLVFTCRIERDHCIKMPIPYHMITIVYYSAPVGSDALRRACLSICTYSVDLLRLCFHLHLYCTCHCLFPPVFSPFLFVLLFVFFCLFGRPV